MQRLYIERFYLNRADDEYPMTVRIILQMKDDVDRHLAEELSKLEALADVTGIDTRGGWEHSME